MIGRIDIQVPIRIKVLGLSFFKNRQVGFSFTNHAILILSKNTGVEMSKIPEWAKENQIIYFAETLYSAYIANCQETYQKPKLNKTQITEGFNMLSDEDKKRVLTTWNESLSFGAKEIPSKKKR